MRRRKGSGKFRTEGFSGEDVNPMDGVANLADVMLVFACGLMLALITFWNVDVAGTQKQNVPDAPRQELTQTVEDLTRQEGEDVDSEGLEEYGTVYRDPETGKLYIAAENGA